MSKQSDNALALVVAALAALLFWPRESQASFSPSPTPSPPLDPLPDPGTGSSPDDSEYSADWPVPDLLPPDGGLFPIPDIVITDEGDDMLRMNALLYAIRRAEHSANDVAAGLEYFTFYGQTYFSNTADHPVLTGEKAGIRLPDKYCLAAGLQPGCVSTAAGAYQINLPTWQRVRVKGPRLNDFSPASQDEAAIRLIKEKRADLLINAGRVQEAFFALSPIWASLPYSNSGQPKRTLPEMMAFYDEGIDRLV